MADHTPITLRPATPSDADAIARLHAESWRRHYRGAYSDDFLDGDVVTERRAYWTARLSTPRDTIHTVVAEDGGHPVGFVHAVLDDDPKWGALVDNLHVAPSQMRRGIGRRLLASAAEAVAQRRPGSPMYLWVLEQNVAAQAFYERLGGRCVERREVSPPGGVASRLAGVPIKLRLAWEGWAR